MKKAKYILSLIAIVTVNCTFAQIHIHVHIPNPIPAPIKKGWDGVKKTVANNPVTTTVVKTALAPGTTVVTAARAATGKESVKQGVTEIRETSAIPAQQAGAVFKAAVTVKSAMHNYVTDRVPHAAAFVLDLGDFMEHYSESTTITTNEYAAMVIAKGNLRYILGIPLAAAIREAKDRFTAIAQPIPADVKQELLKRGFDAKTLEVARYAIGSLEIALPNFVSQYEKYYQHQDMAVTVDNIIVFPKDPGTKYIENCTWWAHELTHVKQYRELGINGFAYSYSRDILHGKSYQDIEMESLAIANATRITNGNNCTSDLMAFLALREKSENSLSTTNKVPGNIHYFTNILAPNEKYLAKVMIPTTEIAGIFLITNMSRIIAVNPITGEGLVAGHAMVPPKPNLQHYAWIFDMPGKTFDYGVTTQGTVQKLSQ